MAILVYLLFWMLIIFVASLLLVLVAYLLASICAKASFDVRRGALGLDDVVVRSTYDEAEKAILNREYDRAEKLYREAIEKNPNDPEPRHRIAVLHEKGGRYAEAVQEFKICAERTHDIQEKLMALFQAADILADKLGQREAAARLLEECIRKHPRTASIEYARRRLEALTTNTDN